MSYRNRPISAATYRIGGLSLSCSQSLAVVSLLRRRLSVIANVRRVCNNVSVDIDLRMSLLSSVRLQAATVSELLNERSLCGRSEQLARTD